MHIYACIYTYNNIYGGLKESGSDKVCMRRLLGWKETRLAQNTFQLH